MLRPQAHGKGQALHGDKTTTGATLISSLQNMATCQGRGAVRHSDRTTPCPKCGKPGIVIDGHPGTIMFGEPTALDGHVVKCGCPTGSNRIIAPLGPLPPNPTRRGPSETNNSTFSLARPTDKLISNNPFDLQFLLTDSNNGKPKPYTPYRITMENGAVIRGISDESGLTKKIFADSPLKATIEAPSYEPAELTYICTDVCQH